MKRTTKFLSLFIFLIGPLLIYNNCSQYDDYSDVKVVPVTKLQETTSKELASNPIAGLCDSSANFSCMQVIFAPNVESGESPIQLPCVNIDSSTRFCVSGTERRYNSQQAIDNCTDCTEQEVLEQYLEEEFTCYNNQIFKENNYPIQAISTNLDEALIKAHELCKQMNRDK